MPPLIIWNHLAQDKIHLSNSHSAGPALKGILLAGGVTLEAQASYHGKSGAHPFLHEHRAYKRLTQRLPLTCSDYREKVIYIFPL